MAHSYKMSRSAAEVARTVKGQRSGRFNLPATQAPAVKKTTTVFGAIMALAQQIFEVPLRRKLAYDEVQDLLKKKVAASQPLVDAQTELREANNALAQIGELNQKIVAAVKAVPGMSEPGEKKSEGEQKRKRLQRGLLNQLARRVLPTEENPEPAYKSGALVAISIAFNRCEPAKEGETDLYEVLRKESMWMERTVSAAILIAERSGHLFGGGDAYDEMAELAFGYLSHFIEVGEKIKKDLKRSAEDREEMGKDLRFLRDQVAVLSTGIPQFVKDARKRRLEAIARQSATAKSQTVKPATSADKPVATPTPVAQVTETSPTLADLEAAVDDDSPIGAFAALMADLAIDPRDSETQVLLRPVEEALRNGDLVSAGMSLSDFLKTYGEMLYPERKAGFESFLKGLETAPA